MAVLALFLFVLIASCNCNLIRSAEDVGTKDVPIPREDIENNDAKPQEVDVDVIPIMPENRNSIRNCNKIGESCTSHGDCCTRACLGYMKKCVSSSGLYPDYLDAVNPGY